jgi:hypothetical protein
MVVRAIRAIRAIRAQRANGAPRPTWQLRAALSGGAASMSVADALQDGLAS